MIILMIAVVAKVYVLQHVHLCVLMHAIMAVIVLAQAVVLHVREQHLLLQ